jgi:type II secretory pathway predicted ATPase ExeA/outer membrane protein OmpA-like peptidoglycan-associated protein
MAQSVDDQIFRHFGLRENPFGVTPDPRFLFMSCTHREALASLVNGIQCGFGFQVLVAQPGMGKTTLLFDFLERFRGSRTAFLFQQQHDSREFLQSLLLELKSESSETSHAKLYSQLNHLLSEAATTRERVIVVVDEAQNLDDPLLETLRQLSNFETTRSKLLQIVLAGQPQLAKRLGRPEQEQLRQRVSTIARLSPLRLDETRTYLNHRLNIAGYRGPEFFTAAALQLIWSEGHGIPRNMNTLCFNAMLLQFAQGARRVDEAAIKEAAQDLDLEFVLADVAGSSWPSDGHANLITTSEASLQAEWPSRLQQPAVLQSAGKYGRPPSGAQPISGAVAASPTFDGDRKPASDGANPGAIPAAATRSSAVDSRQPSTIKPNPGSSVIGREDRFVPSDERKRHNQEPAAVAQSLNQLSKNQLSKPPLTVPSQGTGQGPHISSGRRLFWASLLAAATGTGVLLGHGLGNRGQKLVKEPLEPPSQSQRIEESLPVSDTPVALPRENKGKELDPDADEGPEVIVRTFPQFAPSAPGAAHDNVKTIFFPDDSAEISGGSNITLQRFAEILTASPQASAIIEGHADNFGEEPYNLDLSMRRAMAARDVLVGQYQISAGRLRTMGSGSSAPRESNSTSSGRAHNRRVEMRIVQPDVSLAARSDTR